MGDAGFAPGTSALEVCCATNELPLLNFTGFGRQTIFKFCNLLVV